MIGINKSGPSGLGISPILALLFAALVLFGQDGTVTLDPPETGVLAFSFRNIVTGFTMALIGCGGWKGLMWLFESRRSSIAWTKLRVWWPSGMLVCGWLMLSLFSRNESQGSFFDAVLFVFVLLNLPAVVAVGMLVGLMNETFGIPIWARVTIGSIVM
jgi:hypothetical protein